MQYVILKSENKTHIGKSFGFDGSDKVNIPKRFFAYPTQVRTIEEFSSLALDLEANHSDATLILGKLTEYGERKANNQEAICRDTKHITDRKQRLVFLDVEYEDGLQHLNDLERIEAHIKRLPSCFHNVDYHYQFSSGYRIKDESLRVHIFMLAHREIETPQLRKYLESLKPLVDPQPIQHQTAIFMTKPRFTYRFDDVVENRSGIVKKGRTLLYLPNEAYKPVKRIYEPVSHIKYNGIISEDVGARGELDRIVLEARNLIDERNSKIFSHSMRLGRFVGANRLSYDEVFSAIYGAYTVNGFLDKRIAKLGSIKGKSDMERSIKRGITKGAQNPLLAEVYEPEVSPRRTFKSKAPKEKAVNLSPTDPKQIKQTTEKLIIEAIERSESRSIEAIQIITGAGKSKALLQISGERFKKGESVIYLVGNHSLIEGKGGSLQRLKELHPDIEPDVWKGRALQCSVLNDVKTRLQSDNLRIKEEAEKVHQEHNDLLDGGVSIPAFCKYISCPKYETSSCSAWKEPERPIENRFIIAPHSYLSYLSAREEKGELPENVLIIIDELPELSPSTSYEFDLLKPLVKSPNESKYDDEQTKFKATHQQITRFATVLQPLIEKTFNKVKVNQYGGDLLLTPELLFDGCTDGAIELVKNKAQIMLTHLDEMPINPPKLSKKRAEEVNQDGRRIRRRAIKALAYIARLITNELAPGEKLHLVITSFEQGAVKLIERGAPLPLPETSRLIVADATPRTDYFHGYAKSIGFSLNIEKAQIIPHRLNGWHIDTHAFQSGVMFDSGSLSNRSIKAINDMAHPINLALRKIEDGKEVAIASSKAVRELIEQAFRGQGLLAESQLIKVLSRFKLRFGHTGKDHRGSNEFEHCSALVLLGEPRWNVGATKRQADRILDKSATEEEQRKLYREEVEAIVLQWVGRLRTVWNKDRVFVYASPIIPEEEIPNTSWNQYEKRGRSIGAEQQVIELKAHKHLDRGERLSIALIMSWGLSNTSARRMIQRIGSQRPLIKEDLPSSGGRPPSEWYDQDAVKAMKSKKKLSIGGLLTESAIRSFKKRLKDKWNDFLQPLKEEEPIYNILYALSVKSPQIFLSDYDHWEKLVFDSGERLLSSASKMEEHYDRA